MIREQNELILLFTVIKGTLYIQTKVLYLLGPSGDRLMTTLAQLGIEKCAKDINLGKPVVVHAATHYQVQVEVYNLKKIDVNRYMNK